MAMSALDKKLLRDLRRIWAQAIAVALVLAAGIATLILAVGTYQSLDETRTAYYERYRFGHVFAYAKRAPADLREKIAQIPGVAAVETRIASGAILDIPGLHRPASARVLSPAGTWPTAPEQALYAHWSVAGPTTAQ